MKESCIDIVAVLVHILPENLIREPLGDDCNAESFRYFVSALKVL